MTNLNKIKRVEVAVEVEAVVVVEVEDKEEMGTMSLKGNKLLLQSKE